MIVNWLAIEPLLVERLKSGLDPEVYVASVEDVVSLEESALADLNVLLLYGGERLGSSAGSGSAGIEYQRWIVAVAVRLAVQSDGGAARRAEAGPILSTVRRLLSGWEPGPDFGEFTKIAPPAPYYSPSFGYFPVSYETLIVDGD